jgi:glyoxylase I family protein
VSFAPVIRGMHHVGISVASFERSVDFYRDVFGMTLVAAPETFGGAAYERLLALPGAHGRVAMLVLGTLRVELFEFQQPLARTKDASYPVADHGLTHFCIEVVHIERIYEDLMARGLRCHSAPMYFEGEGYAAYIRDPDGNVIELFEAGPRKTTAA